MASGWSPIGSHHVKLILEPGQVREIIFVLGYHENDVSQKFDPPESTIINKETVRPVIKKYLDQNAVNEAFVNLKDYWHDLLGKYQVSTPDEHVNRMVNIWNAYQCVITFNLSRSASYFESGIGRGMGFRDSNQDLLGFTIIDPQRARERILDLASTQLETGGAFHQYQPLTKRGNNEIGGNFNDDPLWLILSTANYLKETGDWEILNEPAVFESKEGTEQPLIEHIRRSLYYVHDRQGPHGLPLIGRADWNDCLNLNCFSTDPTDSFQTTENTPGAVAESVFIAGLFVWAGKELAEIHKHEGLEELASQFSEWVDEMEATIRQSGWDGNWFLRAYDASGEMIGSHTREEGQIFIEPQGICICAGIGIQDGLAATALDSVEKYLATPHGILLHQPAFTRYYLNLGEISSYPPGYKENASVFCHTNPWIIIAETKIGNGDLAYDYYMRTCPSAREKISETHRCEPYVYSQTIAGRDAPNYGEAKNSWLTGAAAWTYVSITNWILGIRPSITGLEIQPVIPTDWSGFKATRVFRGVTYNISVQRAGTGNNVTLEVNGEGIEGNIVPLPGPGVKEMEVNITLM